MRYRHRRGGDGGGLTDPAGSVRPAVEAALDVARHGLRLDPPVQPPSGLRPYLSFAKLSPAALRAIAKVVDTDVDFRAHVTAAVDEERVGRAGWLWLSRPNGWEVELQQLESEALAEAEAVREERSERNARRKLAAARDAAARATATAKQRTDEVERLRSELATERARRVGAEDRVKELSTDLERLREDRSRVVRNLKDVEARLVERSADLNRTKEQLRDLERRSERPAPEPASQRVRETDHEVPLPLAETTELAEIIGAAALGASSLGDALGRLGTLVEGWTRSPPGTTGPSGPTGPAPTPRVERRDDQDVAPMQRVPVRLPGGVLDDSFEAADHLLGVPNVLVLIDGYNVTMQGWPDLTVAEQRARLLNALDGIAARRSVEVEVVFDGADVEAPHRFPTGPRDVRVRFSPAGVEADDVLLELVAQIPPARPVVVVSSDKRVRYGSRRHGANLLHASQLLALV